MIPFGIDCLNIRPFRMLQQLGHVDAKLVTLFYIRSHRKPKAHFHSLASSSTIYDHLQKQTGK